MPGLLALPPELRLLVGEHLDEEDGLHLALTCRALRDAGFIGMRSRATVVGLAGWRAFCNGVAAEPALGRSIQRIQIISQDRSFPPDESAPLLSDAPILPICCGVEWQYSGPVGVRTRSVSTRGNSRVSSLFALIDRWLPKVFVVQLTLPGSVGDFGALASVPPHLVRLEIVCVQRVDSIMPLLWACGDGLLSLSLVMPSGKAELEDLASACPDLEMLHLEAPSSLLDIELPPLIGLAISTPGEDDVPVHLLRRPSPTLKRLHLDIRCDHDGLDLTDVSNAIIEGSDDRWPSLARISLSFHRADGSRVGRTDEDASADEAEAPEDRDDVDEREAGLLPCCDGLDPCAKQAIVNLSVWTRQRGILFAWAQNGTHLNGHLALGVLHCPDDEASDLVSCVAKQALTLTFSQFF